MLTSSPNQSSGLDRRWWRVLVAALLGGWAATAPTRAAPREVSSRSAPERDYRLFVGVDLKVMDEDELRQIADFDRRRALLEGPDKKQIADKDLGSIRFIHTTKLGRHALTIADLDVQRGFSTGSDERMESMVSQNALQTYDQDRLQQLELSVISAAAYGPGGPIDIGGGQLVDVPDVREALDEFQTYQQSNAITSDDEFFSRQDGKVDPTKFNTLMLSATLSSPVPVADTYAVGIARIRTDKKGSSDVVIFHEIGDLTPEPRTVEIRQPGLPPGFEVLDVKLHIFREGQELVSDQSAKQFALTREEAIEYLALERISSNRGQTLPAEPAWSLAPAALLAGKRPEEFDCPLTVHVDERGRVTKIDEATIAPAPIPEIVADLLFLPAIQDGKTIASIAKVNLYDFFR